MANGIKIWEGPSEIDGQPIMVIATGLKASSRNTKTGNLIQTWILRSDIKPTDAAKSGANRSICGDYPHRGEIVDGKNVNRSCYVTIFQAPLSIYGTTKRGKYGHVSLDLAAQHFTGRNVRLGAYGDPAAVPFEVWEAVLKDAARGTGYTHQWKTTDSRFAQYCMASVDNTQEAQEAQAKCYRTFRVGTPREKMARGEFLCPASKEAGQKTNCAVCLACGGLSSPNLASVFIPVHGTSNKVAAFERRAN